MGFTRDPKNAYSLCNSAHNAITWHVCTIHRKQKTKGAFLSERREDEGN